MGEMGYGINRGVMGTAYTIVEKSKGSHPFCEGSAGRAWFEDYMRHHPKLTVRSPQALSYPLFEQGHNDGFLRQAWHNLWKAKLDI